MGHCLCLMITPPRRTTIEYRNNLVNHITCDHFTVIEAVFKLRSHIETRVLSQYENFHEDHINNFNSDKESSKIEL